MSGVIKPLHQTPDKTLHNALRVLTLIGCTDIPVAGGAHKPISRELIIADSVHGESGLDGPELPEPAFAPVGQHGVALMAEKILTSAQPVTLVPTGPLTNIALLLATYPECKDNIEQIVLMGGSAGAGNWSPAAEFNILVDPEAADIVFCSGLPVVMHGLDVTHKAQVMADDIERIRAIDNRPAQVVAELLNFFMLYHRDPKWGFEGAPLHDPCTIAYLINPDLFSCINTWVGVETKGEHTLGMTVVDRYQLSGNQSNAKVVMDLDRAGFIELLVERLGYYNH